jgi:hypothetical protein
MPGLYSRCCEVCDVCFVCQDLLLAPPLQQLCGGAPHQQHLPQTLSLLGGMVLDCPLLQALGGRSLLPRPDGSLLQLQVVLLVW